VRFVDLSLPLEDDGRWMPWWLRTRVKRQGHGFGRRAMRLLFGVGRRHLRTGLGWANDVVSMSTHGTTHVDAPWHYAPTCDGKPARTIDQMPLDTFYGPGIVLDIRHMESNDAADVADLQGALRTLQAEITPGDVVLIRTGNDRTWGQREYAISGPGVSPEATRWLIDQGVRLMGIDAWGWDAPLKHQARQARQTGRGDIFFAAHYVGVDREYCHMERLANLDKIPATGFQVCAFPLKVRGGSAGPARVVAMVDTP
jgi:kynurenine formamidase